MKCPWCNKQVNVPTVAYLNAENYGNNGFTFKHKCGNNIAVHIERIVKLTGIYKINKPDPNYSWSSEPI